MVMNTIMTLHLDKLVDLAVLKQASNLQFKVGLPPCLTLRGELRPLNMAPLGPQDVLRLLAEIVPQERLRELKDSGSCTFPQESERLAPIRTVAKMAGEMCEFVLHLETIQELPITDIDRRLS